MTLSPAVTAGLYPAVTSLPVEVLQGIYLGILTGILPALVAWGMGFLFKYFTGVSIPGFGVVVMALALAGVNGGLLALTDETILNSATGAVVITAIIVVLMLSLYAHAKGDAMGAVFPKRLSLRSLRERTLSADVVEFVGGRGQAAVTVVGEIGDIEGYPPLTAEIRQGVRDGEWRFPADLPIGELESRFAERLRTEFDLAEVVVTLDERANATVAAAPPLSGLSKRVPQGHRAVSVDALVPTGLARDDVVRVHTDATSVRGTVLGARSTAAPAAQTATDGGTTAASAPPEPTTATAATGGEGRVTVAVPRAEAPSLLRADRARIVVRSRGTHREFELISLLRRAGKRFRKLTVGGDADIVGQTLGEASLRERHRVAVLAVRRPGGWTLAPRGNTELDAGDELFAVGAREALDALAEAVA
jgi:hypothetical protein